MAKRMAVVAAVVALASVACTRAQEESAGNFGIAPINGHPNLSGVWQAMNTANWNLEAHSATALDEFWRLGSLASIPAGRSVVVEGNIPYLADAVAQRDANRAGWPKADPETVCYLPGIPRASYMPYPWEIIQGDGNIFIAYSFASANRTMRSAS